MLSKPFSLIFILGALVSPGFASSNTAEASTKIEPGVYEIVNSASGNWARSFPGPPHGPWILPIMMSTQFSSGYQMWEVTPYEEGYKIVNVGSKNSVFSHGQPGGIVGGFPDGFTKWYIEAAGGSEYHIHYPNKDLIWTVDPGSSTIILEPGHGGDNQIFRFDKT